MPRLRGPWCKAVIDSIHHCTYNLTRIDIISQILSRNNSGITASLNHMGMRKGKV